MHDFFVTTPKGMESLLAGELRQLGIAAPRVGRAGVACRGSLEQAYRVCLWSRLASRVLLGLGHFEAASPEALYEGIRGLDWGLHLSPDGTLAVDAQVRDSSIRHSHYAALTVKDAVVDQFRERTGSRPSVDTERPDVRINLYLIKNRARLSLDLSGASLHRRGYRARGVAAPLKENLAAALLIESGWPALAAEGAPCVDLMCGSGTLPIEAALIAGDIAPALQRAYFGFLGWRGHEADLWQRLREEALQRRAEAAGRIPKLLGFDVDRRAVSAAQANLAAAGLGGCVHIERRPLEQARCEGCGERRGLVLINPPYGERIGAGSGLPALYRSIGQTLKQHFPGWRAALFTGNAALESRLGLKRDKRTRLYNGPIACELIQYPLPAARSAVSQRPVLPGEYPGEDVQAFSNRLRKNARHYARWAARAGIDCYRVYDADLPDYALAVDLYQGDSRWVQVQEYQAPARIDPERAAQRCQAALGAIGEVLEVAPEKVFYKQRRRQRGAAQYSRQARSGRFHPVREFNARFLVNLEDYLDTGLFLDHRPLRRLIQEQAAGKRFLNLFCYTGAATVHAALGGASESLSVDLSKRYLAWAERNLLLNGCDPARHRRLRADVLAWLEQAEVKRELGGRFDLALVDPPAFSNSKRMNGVFDVQRDHVTLIRRSMALLKPDGQLFFSTNLRRFELDRDGLRGYRIDNLSQWSIPEDFKRRPDIHRCFSIRHAS